MLNRIPEIVLGVLLAVAVFAMGMLLSWQPSDAPKQEQATNQSKDQGADYNPFVRFWSWTSHDPVAFYTFVLAIFTGVLGATAIVQIRYLRKADETARISADTAREAFIASQRPKLRIRNVVLDPVGGPNDPVAYFVPESRVTGSLHIANVGGHRADILNGHCTVHWDGNEFGLPMNPPYDVDRDNLQANSRSLLSGQSTVVRFRSDREMGIEAEDVQTGAWGQQRLFVMGFVRYADRNNAVRRTTFCREFRRSEDAPQGRFYPVVDDDYEHED